MGAWECMLVNGVTPLNLNATDVSPGRYQIFFYDGKGHLRAKFAERDQ